MTTYIKHQDILPHNGTLLFAMMLIPDQPGDEYQIFEGMIIGWRVVDKQLMPVTNVKHMNQMIGQQHEVVITDRDKYWSTPVGTVAHSKMAAVNILRSCCLEDGASEYDVPTLKELFA